MIARIRAAIRNARIRHHAAVADACGTACLMAQLRRDWPAAARLMGDMHTAQAKRDALLSDTNWSVHRRPNGDFEIRRP